MIPATDEQRLQLEWCEHNIFGKNQLTPLAGADDPRRNYLEGSHLRVVRIDGRSTRAYVIEANTEHCLAFLELRAKCA